MPRFALLASAVLCLVRTAGAEGFPSTMELKEETGRNYVYEVRFPSPVESPFEANNTVWGKLYVPKGRQRPPVVLALPIMAAPNVWIEERFVHAFVRRGLAVFLLEMPYQFHRVPAPLVPSGQVFLARKADRLGANFRQSIADARRAVTWLETCGKVDGRRIGLFGVSLGGIVSAAVFSRDSRPAGAVLFLAGADFPALVFKGEITSKFVKRAGITREEMAAAWAGLDPGERREENKGKRVFLINARGDKVIPRENALALKRAFPDSEQLWVPFGHYTAIVHLLWAPRYAAAKFAGYLGLED